jgi:hypothetical protein
MRRIGAVALVVLLAGCPSLGGGLTPTSTPEFASAGDAYPPGVGPSGVDGPARLAGAHDEQVSSTSYTLVSNRTIEGADGRLRSRIDIRLELAADRDFRVAVRTAGFDGPLVLGRPPASATFWSNGSVHARALRRGNETTYNRFTPVDGHVGTWRYWRSTAAFGGAGGYAYGWFRSVFSDVRTRLARTGEADGTRLFYLEGRSVRAANFARVGDGPIRNLSLDVAVTGDGLVRRVDLRYDRSVDGQPVTVRWTLAYEDVGATTVERPPWLDRALAGQEGSP